MSEIVVAIDTHSPRNKRDVFVCRCGARVDKGGKLAHLGTTESPDSMFSAAPGEWVCMACAKKIPWTNEAIAELGVTWEDFVPSIPNPLDLRAQVPTWFVKALKHSETVQLAYWLGHHRGRSER